MGGLGDGTGDEPAPADVRARLRRAEARRRSPGTGPAAAHLPAGRRAVWLRVRPLRPDGRSTVVPRPSC